MAGARGSKTNERSLHIFALGNVLAENARVSGLFNSSIIRPAIIKPLGRGWEKKRKTKGERRTAATINNSAPRARVTAAKTRGGLRFMTRRAGNRRKLPIDWPPREYRTRTNRFCTLLRRTLVIERRIAHTDNNNARV